jgi:hypothetical protein
LGKTIAKAAFSNWKLLVTTAKWNIGGRRGNIMGVPIVDPNFLPGSPIRFTQINDNIFKFS